jgi:DNA polymerase-3 subunit beta
VVASRTPKPILQCVKLTAEKNSLTVAATDMEVAIRYHDEQVQVEEEGESVLPADKLRDIVRESIDDTLSIETSGETLSIKGQDSVFKIYTQKGEDFPPVPDFEGHADVEVPAGPFKQLINQTAFAAARESTRYAFNGVLMVAKGKKITLVATDGRRLALARGDLANAEKLDKEGKSAIVPSKALGLLDKLLGDPEELVGIQFRENQIIFHTSSATLTSNLVEGQFPPYEDVIPKDADKKMQATTADLLNAVKRAALLTSEESRGVRFSLNKKGLVLTSRVPEAGESTINYPCRFDGADVEIGFNPQFVADALKVVDQDEITLELTTPNRPGLIRGGANFLYVIMPVNLQ